MKARGTGPVVTGALSSGAGLRAMGTDSGRWSSDVWGVWPAQGLTVTTSKQPPMHVSDGESLGRANPRDAQTRFLHVLALRCGARRRVCCRALRAPGLHGYGSRISVSGGGAQRRRGPRSGYTGVRGRPGAGASPHARRDRDLRRGPGHTSGRVEAACCTYGHPRAPTLGDETSDGQRFLI